MEDLRKQFNAKPRTKEEKQQYLQEVERVKETATADIDGVFVGVID